MGVSDVARDLTSVRSSHVALAGWLGGLDEVDPTTPSQLPGWTVGHVLTHIARNADSHRSMLAGHAQYPHGREGRDADIEAGAGRPWVELVDDVAASNLALETAWDAHDDWDATSETVGGPRPTELLPLLRQREVEIHRVDLGLGYRLDDLPADYVRRDLRLMVMLWRARKPMGLTTLPEAALHTSPARRLGWLMGRVEIDGLGPAGIMG